MMTRMISRPVLAPPALALALAAGACNPVDTFIETQNVVVSEACRCYSGTALIFPIWFGYGSAAGYSSEESCLGDMLISPGEEGCVHGVLDDDKATRATLECQEEAREIWASCIVAADCNLIEANECVEDFGRAVERCPVIAAAVTDDLRECVD